mmetsp:Transcript_60941/g.170042  ORF Transcript_60941/g.170042 Transcript_60941/m.170042 type:complete len:126 (+) Transcript_60941:386-763(+)
MRDVLSIFRSECIQLFSDSVMSKVLLRSLAEISRRTLWRNGLVGADALGLGTGETGDWGWGAGDWGCELETGGRLRPASWGCAARLPSCGPRLGRGRVLAPTSRADTVHLLGDCDCVGVVGGFPP